MGPLKKRKKEGRENRRKKRKEVIYNVFI